MSADETKRLETLEAELKTLKADKEKNATEFTAIKAENTQLKGSLTKLHEEKHLAHVSEVLDLRSRAGLFEEKDRGAEIERLKTLSGEALTQMASDLTVLVRRVEATSGPKAKFTAAQASSVEEQAREGLFGYRRDEKGVIVHG